MIARVGAPVAACVGTFVAAVCARLPVAADIGFGEFLGGDAQELVIQASRRRPDSLALVCRAAGAEESEERIGIALSADGVVVPIVGVVVSSARVVPTVAALSKGKENAYTRTPGPINRS